MEFTNDAKIEIEKNLKDINRNINLDEKDRIEIEKELRSTYYEAAESSARARGANTVTIDDVNTAKAGLCTPKETAESYMKSYANSLSRAGFWPRLVAYIIDNIVLGVSIAILTSPMLVLMLILDVPFSKSSDYSWMGQHSPAVLALFFALMLVTIISDVIVGIGYYIVLEGHFGFTIGKYLLGMRVLKTDGTKIGYKEALLRNIPKYINNLIAIDALIMLIFFNKEKQRGFDKVANTMVVHARS